MNRPTSGGAHVVFIVLQEAQSAPGSDAASNIGDREEMNNAQKLSGHHWQGQKLLGFQVDGDGVSGSRTWVQDGRIFSWLGEGGSEETRAKAEATRVASNFVLCARFAFHVLLRRVRVKFMACSKRRNINLMAVIIYKRPWKRRWFGKGRGLEEEEEEAMSGNVAEG
ncbi:hypothetical protein PoB_002928300 [Plakobranchus ocellatus]|uniref:Uncharacterized protein n=1 Tax=Plakobranchus ocellatus TaxID=259542 RepID=A0AAV4A7S1_9GAST|nr:hypothetical protein PoB_002928300 [Plakobranchus ocellatus]